MTSVRSERGAAAVEFALIVLPFMLIVGLLVDVGWVYSQQQAVTNAARVGARYYAIHHLESSAQGDAEQRARDVATGAKVAGPITFSYASTCVIGADSMVTMVVTAPMTNLTGMIPAFGGSNTVQGKASMRCGG